MISLKIYFFNLQQTYVAKQLITTLIYTFTYNLETDLSQYDNKLGHITISETRVKEGDERKVNKNTCKCVTYLELEVSIFIFPHHMD